MRTILKALSLLVALVATCASTAPVQVSLEDQLAVAEAKWAANRPKIYEITIRQLCFCGPIPPGWEPIVVHVENAGPDSAASVVSGARAIDYQTGSLRGMDKWLTVERQFNFIRGELAKPHYRMEIDYDVELGYPRRIFIDPQQYA